MRTNGVRWSSMYERRCALSIVFVTLACLVAIPAAADGGAVSGPDPLERARGEVKAGRYEDALALFEQAMKAAPQNLPLLAESTRCAIAAEKYTVAVELAKRGLKQAKVLKDPTEAESALPDSFRELRKTAERKKKIRDEFVPRFIEQLIKKIHKHKAVIDKRQVEIVKVDPGIKQKEYRLRDELTDGTLDVLYRHSETTGMVGCLVIESHRDEKSAGRRLDTIRDQVRKRLKFWAARVRFSKRGKPWLFAEWGNDWTPHREKSMWVARRVTFGDGNNSRWMAKVSIQHPIEKGKEKPHPSEPYQVEFRIRSGFFR